MNVVRSSAVRSTMIAAVALMGSVATFGVTASPVHAAEAYYTAKLAAPVTGQQRAVLGDTLWTCSGDSCSAPRDTSRPQITCERLARKFGDVTAFTTPKGDLEADKLATCNKK